MKTSINLLPASYRRQLMLRRRAVQWSCAICVVLLSSWVWMWSEQREGLAIAQELEVLEREHVPTQRMLQEVVDMRGKLEQLQQHEAIARELEQGRSALTLLGVISRTAQQTGGRLRVTKLELTDFQNATHVGGPASTTVVPASGLLLSGVSLDNPAVLELLDGLQDAGIFRRVELGESKERQDAEASLRDYQIRCEF
ncbi:MAG: PilN domain-containing protein [Pirellulales bacterium]